MQQAAPWKCMSKRQPACATCEAKDFAPAFEHEQMHEARVLLGQQRR
jgi:hypothetical protein